VWLWQSPSTSRHGAEAHGVQRRNAGYQSAHWSFWQLYEFITKPSAHSDLVPASRSPLLGCGNPTQTHRPLAGRPVGSAPDDTGQVKHTFKTFGELAFRKRRRHVSDDPLKISAVEPKGPATPPEESSESVTITDVDQPDVKRTHTDRLRTQQCFCVNVSELEEKNVAASVLKKNQCYQDHVNAIWSRFDLILIVLLATCYPIRSIQTLMSPMKMKIGQSTSKTSRITFCRDNLKHSNLNFGRNRNNDAMHLRFISLGSVIYCVSLSVSKIWEYQNTVTFKKNDKCQTKTQYYV